MTYCALKIIWVTCLLNISSAVAFTAARARLTNFETVYQSSRKALLNAEENMIIGSNLQLNWKERQVDSILKRFKQKEFETGVDHPETFAPALHFFRAKPLIELSPVFRLLQRMPKGAVLHAHNSAMVSSSWIIQNLTYRSDIMKCTRSNGQVIFTFRQVDTHKCATNYVRIVDERQASTDREQYDIDLEKNINLYTPNPNLEYTDINLVWRKFQSMFQTLGDVITYEETFGLIYTQIMQELYDDHIMYAEIRTSFSTIYHKTGRDSTKSEVVTLLRALINDFKKRHTNFLGVKFIFSVSRNAVSEIDNTLKVYQQLRAAHPDLVIGIDFNGQEDMGTPLADFTAELLPITRETNFFFHAGETNWNGYSSDRNLFDAILLNTTRIGHGYSLYKHPILLNMVKQRHICIEVCPISNQVLKLVTDMRNHPANYFVSQNLPIIISNDDPGFWIAKGVSYDFYYALMSLTPAFTGLSFVKQLALNSIIFSIFTIDERHKAMNIFNQQWNTFLDTTINSERFVAT